MIYSFKKKILLFFVALLTLSCNNNNNNNNKTNFKETSNSNIKPLKISVNKSDSTLILDERNFKLGIVRLDSNCLVGAISKVLNINNLFFVLDIKTSSFFCFNNDGSKKWGYSKLGRGPGEHSSLKDFCVRDNFIYLFDDQLRELKLDINGKFVSQKQISFKDNYLSPTCFFIDENRNVVTYSSDLGDKKYDFPFKIAVLDSNLLDIKSVFLNKTNSSGEKRWQNSQFPMQTFIDNSGFFYTEALNDTIYAYNAKEKFIRKYLVDFGEYKTPQFFLDKKKHTIEEFWASNYGGNISSIFETGSILTFKTFIAGGPYFHFVDKSNWTIKNYKGIQLKSGEFSFAVDFIGGAENKLYFKVEPYSLLQGYNFYKNNKYKSLSIVEYSNKIKKEMPLISTLLNGTSMNSNTILISVEMTKNTIFR